METMLKALVVLVVVLAIIVGVFAVAHPAAQTLKNGAQKLITTVSYQCSSDKTMQVAYYEGSTTPAAPGQPPHPNGSVKVALSDGRNLDLPQTISGSGIRYANGSLIFWSKGKTAFLEENGTTTYADCAEQQ